MRKEAVVWQPTADPVRSVDGEKGVAVSVAGGRIAIGVVSLLAPGSWPHDHRQ